MLYAKHPLIFPKWPDLAVLATAVGCQRIVDSNYRYQGSSKGKNWSLIQITLSGSGRLSVNGETHQLNANKAMILNFPSECQYWWEPESAAWEFIYINLAGREAQRVCAEIINAQGNCVDISNNPEIITELCSIIDQAESRSIKDPFSLSSMCYRFLMEMEKFNHLGKEENIPGYLSQSLQFIRDNIQTNLSVQDIANEVGYSRFHFSRAFKTHLNMSPQEFINRLKMENAVELLQQGQQVHDVAKIMGYDDASYFCKVFKNHFKISPGKFARSAMY